jgi:hypothetical protein
MSFSLRVFGTGQSLTQNVTATASSLAKPLLLSNSGRSHTERTEPASA